MIPKEFFDIKMPKNSAMGMILCVTSGLIAFGLVWYLWWLVVAAALAAFAAIVGRGFARDTKKIIPASEVERAHMRWLAIVAASRPISRALEVEPANVGLAPTQSGRLPNERRDAAASRDQSGPAHRDANENAEELLFGFWVFLMSDAILFGLLFATYATMLHSTAGGPGPAKLFDIKSAFIETLALLSSSFTYGMASLAEIRTQLRAVVAWLGMTLSLR